MVLVAAQESQLDSKNMSGVITLLSYQPLIAYIPCQIVIEYETITPNYRKRVFLVRLAWWITVVIANSVEIISTYGLIAPSTVFRTKVVGCLDKTICNDFRSVLLDLLQYLQAPMSFFEEQASLCLNEMGVII